MKESSKNHSLVSNQSVLQNELPFYPNDIDPLFDSTVSELLLDGYTNYKYSPDGFINFYSLKMCSSNAKQMAKFMELSMGFEEIAYRGLETDSRTIASHVLRNGLVIIEIVNTLETAKEDETLKTPFYQDDLPGLVSNVEQDYSTAFIESANDIVNDFVDKKIDNLSLASTSDKLGEKIRKKVMNSKEFKNSCDEYAKIIGNIVSNSEMIYNDVLECSLIQSFLNKHGEGVMDISFLVEEVDKIFAKAVEAGAGIIKLPTTISDENGTMKIATVSIPQTDIQHTLIQNINYRGPYLPRYSGPSCVRSNLYSETQEILPEVNLECIDHCVENYSWNQMMIQAKFYANIFGFHKFWSVDEQDVSTGNTALKSIVMASGNGKIKMPINEPAKGKKRSQIEEFNDFNGGPGIQHIALRTNDIVTTVKSLMSRGIVFNTITDTYYATLKERLRKDDIVLKEDMEQIQSLNILVDYDPATRNKYSKNCNYILQIFTAPLHDRPTLFFEIIQRHHHNGFGKGTFKGLFETIEQQQQLRGTLVDSDHP